VAQVSAELLGDLGGQTHGRRRRGLEEGVVVRKLQHLLIGRVGQFIAPIADRDAPKARHPVQQRVAVAVVNGATLGAGDDAAAPQLDHQLMILLAGQVMGEVEPAQLGDIVVADRRGHDRVLL
jgi:hypothetical protein